jgi:hypothetical protein
LLFCGSDEAVANLLVARTLLVEDHIAEARKGVDQAMRVATETHNRELEWSAALTAARVRAASGNPAEISESIAGLDRVIEDATAARFADVALEARLALGEIEMKSGNRAAGRASLESLERESTSGGFLAIARKAAAALRTVPSRTSS